MKKIINKNTLFGIIIGIILCSGIVYGVNLYKSEDISYEPTDASWEVSNVNDAIDSLYVKTKEIEKPYDVNTFGIWVSSNGAASSTHYFPCKGYSLLSINATNYRNNVTTVHGCSSITCSGNQDNLITISDNGTYTVDISEYDYISIIGTSSSTGYVMLSLTFS